MTSRGLCFEQIFVTASRGFSVKREARTAPPHCAAMCRAHDRKCADTSTESSLQRFSAFTAKNVGRHHVADSGARLAVVKALAALDPLSGLAALTTTRSRARMALT